VPVARLYSIIPSVIAVKTDLCVDA